MAVSQPKFVDATFYAVVVPEWDRHWKDDSGRPRLNGAKVDRITQKRPERISGGAVVTRLTLRIDATALLPLQPQAVIHISPGQVEVIEVIEVNAADPSDEDGEG